MKTCKKSTVGVWSVEKQRLWIKKKQFAMAEDHIYNKKYENIMSTSRTEQRMEIKKETKNKF